MTLVRLPDSPAYGGRGEMSTVKQVQRSLRRAEKALRTSPLRLRPGLAKAERKKLNTLLVNVSQLRKLRDYLQSYERLVNLKPLHIPVSRITGQRSKGLPFEPNDDPRMFVWDGTKFWQRTKLGKHDVLIVVDRPILDLLQKVLSEWEFRTVVARGDGRSWDELADVSGLSPSTLRTYERRAIAKVNRLMKTGELQAAVERAAAAYPHLQRTRRRLLDK